MRYLEAGAGVTVATNPAPEILGANYDIKPDDRFMWIPSGVRGVLPLRGGRVKHSAGGGFSYPSDGCSPFSSVLPV
jgi:hypothetical protein